jgi:hypothetical protein
MGSWNLGPFDNAAADFLGELEPSPSRSVTKALRTIAKSPDGHYIEVDEGSAAWAACELVALAFGYGDLTALNEDILQAVERLKPKENQRLLALQVLPRIASRTSSELADLWHDSEETANFDASLDDLRARLEAASAGPHTRPRARKRKKRRRIKYKITSMSG